MKQATCIVVQDLLAFSMRMHSLLRVPQQAVPNITLAPFWVSIMLRCEGRARLSAAHDKYIRVGAG